MSKQKKSFNNNKQTRQALSGTSVLWKMNLNVLAGAAIIVLVAILAYLPSICGGFVLDDDLFVTENNLITASKGLYPFWCTSEAQDYWPVINTTLWIEWRLWETTPMGYHVSNLVLHIIEALLIWVILEKIRIPGAFLAAMIFALHPVNVESVAWISSRKNIMAMLFFLLSILWYVKTIMPLASVGMAPVRSHGGPRERAKARPRVAALQCIPLSTAHLYSWYCLSLIAFMLAMLSKGSVAVLPLLLLGIVWWLRSLTLRDLVRIAPFFLLAVVLAGVNIWFQTHGKDLVFRNAGFMERLLGAGGVVWFYLYKALLPFDLAFIYPPWNIQVGDPLSWLPLLAAIIVTAMLWRYRNGWSRPLLFFWGFFCVSLVPVLGFTDVGFMKYSLVADRYQHIAIIGAIALAAAGWSVWRQWARTRTHLFTTSVAVAAMCTLAFLTWRQSGIYNNAVALYQATLQKNPGCWLAHNNLGLALADEGRLPEAIKHYRQALLLNHDYTEAHNNLGVALVETGERQEAIEQYRQALRLNPDYIEAHNNLGVALVDAGRPQEAIEQYRQALRLNPDFTIFYCNLALAYAKAQQPSEAIGAAQKGLKIAQSTGQASLAKQIEDWLNSYRAGLPDIK
jgi:protein O-mannosyl-transferase